MKINFFRKFCDLKVGRYRQHFELMKLLLVFKVKVISRPCPKAIYILNVKLNFLRNKAKFYRKCP